MTSIEQLLQTKPRGQSDKVDRFLEHVVFAGIQALSTAFDSAKIRYFTLKEFAVVVERCTEHDILVIGLEMFSPAGRLLGVWFDEDQTLTNDWTVEVLGSLKKSRGNLFSATYGRARE